MSSEELSPRQRAGATKRRRTREQVLNAARRLFDERGYHAVTVEEISQEACVSVPAIYNHFPTKQSVVIGVYAPYVLEIMQSVERLMVDGHQVDHVITDFMRRLSIELHAHLAMAYALLSLAQARGTTKYAESGETASGVSFWQLAEFLGNLLERSERASRHSIPAVEVADFYLSGLLTWIVQHPDRSGEETAAFILAQLL